MTEQKVTVTITQPDEGPETIDVKAPGMTMDEAQVVMQRAANYILFSLIRNTVLRDLQKMFLEREEAANKVILAGEGHVGIDPRRLRS